MKLLSTLSHSSQRYLAALLVLFVFSACSQTPTPNNDQNNPIEISDENGNNLTAQAVPANGLKGDYYDNMDFTGTLKTRYDANVNRNWGTAAPISGIANTTYSVRWTGQILPQYSQEYTFFVTSSGGARLMVNGQALVNNWTDHTSKVDSGKVTLQANVKYDIRLEFFRNTSNPAVIKLEWQSASRTKQVVPQARFYPTGNNVEATWNRAKTQLGTKLNSISMDIPKSTIYLSPKGNFLIVQAVNALKKVSIYEKDGIILYARLSDYSNDVLRVTNLIDDREINFGNLTDYFDSNSANDAAQKFALQEKEKEYFPTYQSTSVQNNNGTRLNLQAVPSSKCKECESLFLEWAADQAKLGEMAIRLELSFALSLAECIRDKNLNCLGTRFQLGVFIAGLALQRWDYAEFIDLFNKLQDTTERLLTCRNTAQCPYRLTQPNPNDIKLREKINFTVTASSTLQNIGYWDMQVKEAYNTSSWLTSNLLGVSAANSSDGFRTLNENAVMTVNIVATCPSIAGVYTDTIIIQAKGALDPDFNETRTIKVTLECYGEPKIQADSKSWSLQINQSLPQPDNIVIRNDGTDILKITNFDYQVGSLGTASITPTLPAASLAAPLEIPAGGSRNIPVTAACGSTVGTLNGTITISSNAVPNGSLSVGVSLECKALPVGRKITMGYIGITNFTGVNYSNPPNPPQCYAKYSYEIWVGINATYSKSGQSEREMLGSGTHTTTEFDCGPASIAGQRASWESFQAGKHQDIKTSWVSKAKTNLSYDIKPDMTFIYSTDVSTPCGFQSWVFSPNVFEWGSCLTAMVYQ